jgi:glycosyltransferase involved in cell wall biosynthesis
MKPLLEARVAIVFEWYQRYGGVERVVTELQKMYPNADFFALVHNPQEVKGTSFEGIAVRTSFIQSLPMTKEKYRGYLPLMPLAVEQFDLRDYDLVISSSHAIAKGVLTRADQLHVSYTHTPVRYAWDLYLDYLAATGMDRGIKGWLVRPVLHYLRLWDTCAANRVDAYLANSFNVARRIHKLYRRPARVVYPPVDVERFRPDLPREEFFLAVSRFVPYKRLDLILEVFTRSGKPIVVIGEGPEFSRAKRIAGLNVKLLGYQSDEVVADHLQRAKAFVSAADEDFGIACVEAQAAGCPVIGYRTGGTSEIVNGWPASDATGIFFDNQRWDTLAEAIELFETHRAAFRPEICSRNAERFGSERFERELRGAVEELWSKFQRGERLE